MKKRKEPFLQTDNISKSTLVLGGIIGTFISISPYFFYLYESVPVTKVWDTFLFSYDSGSWGDANYAMWILTNKLVPLVFLILWFLTCRHWWYHSLLVPITTYIYQTLAIFNENMTHIDEFNVMHLVPIMAIFIPSVYLIRAKMFDRLNTANKSLQQLEDEFRIKPTTLWGKIKQYF